MFPTGVLLFCIVQIHTIRIRATTGHVFSDVKGWLMVALAGLALLAIVVVVVPSQTAQTGPGPIVPPEAQYDPVDAGEPLPEGFRQLLPRDAITPVYNPTFVAAEEAGWSGETLVIGVEIDGDARAYPVSFLNRREMVVDRIAGIPVLVTW